MNKAKGLTDTVIVVSRKACKSIQRKLSVAYGRAASKQEDSPRRL